MSPDGSKSISTLPSWIIALLTGFALAYFYILILSAASVNSGFLVVQFPHVSEVKDTLILLYLGHFLMGLLGSVISAFLIVYVPSFFFRQSPMKFGCVAGVVAMLIFVWVLFLKEGAFPDLWGRRPGFLIIDVLNGMLLIGWSGIVSILGHKTREQFLVLYKEVR